MVLALGALGGLLLAACGSIGQACQFDADCSGGSLCIAQTCYATCTDKHDCQPPYDRCLAQTRASGKGQETVKVCVPQDFNNSTNNNPSTCVAPDCCETDDACVQAFGDSRAVCGMDKRCIIPVPPVDSAVLIRDRTQVDTATQPADGGLGADIAAIYVRTADSDQPLGWAKMLDYSPVNDAQGPASTFDGTAKTLTADGQCVDATFADSAVPLGGDGGGLLVSFEDANGRRLQLNADWQLVVIEWGANCAAAGEADTYDIYYCESAHEGSGGIDPATDCTRQLNANGPVSGYQAVSIGAGG